MARVLVIGGGIAGCAAAVAAAEAGAEVTLLHATAHPGGVAAVGDHRTVCGLAPIDADQPELLHPAQAQPWCEALQTGTPYRQGRVWLWPLAAGAVAQACQQRCDNAGVSRVADTMVESVIIHAGALAGVRTTAGGEWMAAAVIDASGGAHFAQACGAAVRTAQAWGAWRGIIAIKIADGPAARVRIVKQLQAHIGGAAALALTPVGQDQWQLSVDVEPGTQVEAIISGVQAGVVSLGGQVVQSGCAIAQRDHGGWPGELTAQTLFSQSAVDPAESVCTAAWPVEWHGPHGITWQWPERDRYRVPWSCVQPALAPAGLWVVGKGLAASPQAVAALRVMGTQIALASCVGAHVARVACADSGAVKRHGRIV